VRLRLLSAVAAAALAVAGLSACRTNVGSAASADGHRIKESDVSKYLTADAAAVQVSDQQGNAFSVAPRVYVLNTLIDEALYAKLLATTPDGVPSTGEIAQVTEQTLQGQTVHQEAVKNKVVGYTAAFETRWVRTQILGQIINNKIQQGLDIQPIIQKLHFPVTVNPRYGEWDAKNFQLSTAADAGLPDFLTLPSSPAPAPPSATPSA
jgi:hypothetical protein